MKWNVAQSDSAGVERLARELNLAPAATRVLWARDYRQLEQEHPGEYLPFLAAVLSALGSIDQNQNRPDEARAHYEEALAIYGQLSQEHPGKYQSQMEEIVINLSSLK